MSEVPTSVALRQKPSLPQQWAEEIALAASPPTTASSDHLHTPPETLGGPVFDTKLDGFLDRFQQEIVAARALKDDFDRLSASDPAYAAKKAHFKIKMEHIRALFATEGEDFVASLERRNPKLTMAACGTNTLEFAQGIDRLENAVKEEEARRAQTHSPPGRPQSTPPPSASYPAPYLAPLSPSDSLPQRRSPDRGDLFALRTSPDRMVAPPAPPMSVGQPLYNLSSDETLQLMQSDINALKLELMRMQRAKLTDGAFTGAVPYSLPTRSGGPTSEGSFSFSSLSPDKENANPAGATLTAMPNSTSALPASILANNNVNVVRVTGRASRAPTYLSHLEQMKIRMDALDRKPFSRRAKSAARLGRTHTMGSMYEHSLEQAEDPPFPNVNAMVTPPRNNRRNKHRSLSTPQSGTTSPLRVSPVREIPENAVVSAASPSSSVSPNRPPVGSSAGTSPAKLFFDAPEEMLARPQSQAAARDIQRYSLKVARRFVPAVSGERATGTAEPRAKSVVTVSPSRDRKLKAEGGTASQAQHTLSDMGTGGGGGGTSVVGTGTTGGPPSTIETTASGGRVVEEIEGDMWVRKGVVWKRWRRRYASIVSHQFFGKVMCLFSYDSHGGVISTRSQIVVLNGSLCRAMRDRVEIGGAERYMFVLRTSSKEYSFAAESDEVRRNWIRELRDAARIDSTRVTQTKPKGRSMAFRRKG